MMARSWRAMAALRVLFDANFLASHSNARPATGFATSMPETRHSAPGTSIAGVIFTGFDLKRILYRTVFRGHR
jgi:hypothetical protein